MKIKKRDGRIVPFSRIYIENAIAKACEAAGEENCSISEVADAVVEKCYDEIDVEDVQDLVEQELITAGAAKVAKAYILYRNERNKARARYSDAVITSIVNAEHNDITRENANMNADTPAGMMMKFASEKSREYAHMHLLSEEAEMAVHDNLLHVHDLDYMASKSLTCAHHPLNQLLANGFKVGHGEIRAAKRIETASILACISLECCQNEMHGGQAIPAFDFYLAPYVRKAYIEELDKVQTLTGCDYEELKDAKITDYVKRDLSGAKGLLQRVQWYAINNVVDRVHQSMEAFVHNMNCIHSRGGNQVVFSSINFGTDTSAEGRCVIRELLNTTYRGVGNGSTAIFPISIMKLKKGVNKYPEDPNYDLFELACKVTAKRFFPNFLNLDAPFNKDDKWRKNDPKRYEHEVACMGCRTRVYEDRFGEKTSIGRGNLSFSTINLPGLALSVMKEPDEAKRIEAFLSKLKDMVWVTGRQLYDRYKFQCTAMAKQFPLLMSSIWAEAENLKPEDEVRPVLKHGTLGVGFIGLAECLVALVGKHHGESDEAQQLGLKIVTLMRDEVKNLSEHYDLNYSVLATPAEGLSGKFTKKDKKKYGIIPGVTDREYYTNSNHVPVYYHCSAAHKAKIEAPYHDLTRGGHIFYVELDGDATHNVQAIKDIVKLMDKYGIGYGSINHNRNRCLECGYEDAAKDLVVCPNCGGTQIDKLQRITGYLVGTTDRWNAAKLAELNDRVTHD